MGWILVVDDDPFSRRFLEMTLRDAGWTVRGAEDGMAGWLAWESAARKPDVVISDVRMPRLNGYELIERIRSTDRTAPIIAISALGADDQVIQGLEAGADDYLTKPVSGAVLVAKIRAALRRAESGPVPGSSLVVGDLALDASGTRFTRGDTPIALTRTELAVVVYLMRQGGRVVSPAQILGAVWGEAYEDENEILRTTILRIRRKLEPDPTQPRYLRTHTGLGYSLDGD